MAEKSDSIPRNNPTQTDNMITGGGAMGELIRSYDWSKTTLGPIANWPQCLHSSVNLILHSPVPMVMLWGKDGVMIYNDAYSTFAGGRHPSLLGAKVLEGWPEVLDFNRNVLTTVLSGKTLSFSEQELILKRNGKDEKVWMDLNYSPLFNGASKPAGVLAVVVETTQRVLAEQRQKSTEQSLEMEKSRLKEVFDFAPAFLAVAKGKDHTFMMVNKSYYQLVGHRDIIGKPLLEAIPEVRSQGYKEILDDVFETGEPFKGRELKVNLQLSPKSELVERYVDLIYQPMKNLDGDTIGIYAFGYDVTELVTARQLIEKSELELKNSEERFRTLIEKSTDAIQLVDTQGKILYSSESLKNVLGYSADELQAKGVGPYLHPEDKDYFNQKLSELISNPSKPITLQYRVKHKDGSWAWIETTGVNHLKTPTIKALVGTFRNITDKKLSDEALQQQLKITKTITDTTNACLFMIDGNGLVTFLNPAAQVVTGYSTEDAVGKPMHLLIHHSHPDGTNYPESECPLVNTYKYGMPNPLHEDVFFKKDGSAFDALVTGTPIPGANGIQGTVVEFRDITDEKKAQEELRELIAITEQRNALIKINQTKDEFIGMASHQLRTPATAVKQYIGLLMSDFAGPMTTEQNEFLKIAYDSNERELNIINDLLKTAQISSDKYRLRIQAQDISLLIEECIADLKTTTALKQQKVLYRKPKKNIKILFDLTEMKLVIVNLLENASKYSYLGTDITIKLSEKDTHVEIVVSDEGVGIEQENHLRIFDKFTRVDNKLSDTVTGTGLGLFWVKQIIELHEGTIDIKSQLGKGSTFIVKLPR